MSHEMTITFPGGKKVDAELSGHTIRTDQPEKGGGEGSAPAPFDLFLAAIGTCAGFYVLGFCQARNLPTEGIRLRQRATFDAATKTLASVDVDIELPESFPEKYHQALVRAADQCAVKRALEAQPRILVRTVTPQRAA